jgi:hypothetical protein
MADSINFKSGAFAVYEPDDPSTLSRFIPFRFNPETLSRELSMEKGEGSGAPTGAGGGKAGGKEADEQGADANAGTLKESFSVLVRFDLADRAERGSSLTTEYGILPEISALEDLLYPGESATDHPSDGTEAVKARAKLPTVLLLWGEKRVMPVQITGMTINETMFDNRLYPVRAEIEVSLQVLGDTDARDNTRVRSALDFTGSNRRSLAKMFLENTAAEGSNVNLP